VQISNGNLNKLTAPIPMEAFFGDFVNTLFDPLCSYNHSTGKWYITNAVSDFASFSGVFIAVSTSSDPRSPYNIYFLDLTNFGGDGFCAVGFCLADQPNLGSDQYSISISTNQFELNGVLPSGGQFAGAAYIMIDKVALALGAPAPNVVAFDIGVSPGIFPDFAFGDCVNGNIVGAPGPCWYSIQPADAAYRHLAVRQHLVDRGLHPQHHGVPWRPEHRSHDVLAAAAVCAAAGTDRPEHSQRQPAGRLRCAHRNMSAWHSAGRL
jgi:hypothetical protein